MYDIIIAWVTTRQMGAERMTRPRIATAQWRINVPANELESELERAKRHIGPDSQFPQVYVYHYPTGKPLPVRQLAAKAAGIVNPD